MSPVFFLVVTVVCVSAAHICLRRGMADLGPAGPKDLIRHILRSPWVIGGGLLFGVSMLTWLATLSEMRLGLVYPVYVGGSFALVLLGSVFLLGEELTLQRFLGVLAIFGGILLAMP